MSESILQTNMCKSGHTCIYSLEEPILGMLGLPLPAVPRVKVFGQQLHLLLQNLLHRPVWYAFGVHQHRLLQIRGVAVCLVAALSRQRRILVRVGNRVLRVLLALRVAIRVIARPARL